jgi:hypothetical protein
MVTTIHNVAELCEQLGVEHPEQIARCLYKATDCGAWIRLSADSVLVGSIVEGADFGTATYRLRYPFTMEDFDARIQAIEVEADAIWQWANLEGEDEDGRTAAEAGLPPPDIEYPELNPEGRSS